MIDRDYFKDSFDYKKSELFKHSVALWQAGFLNTDKDTASLSFVKDILANDFFIAPYKDNSPLVISNNPVSGKNKTKEKPIIDIRGIFNNWDTLYILCLGRKFIVRRRYLGGTCSFDIFDRRVFSNDTGYRKPTFSIIKTSNSSILQKVDAHTAIGLSWNETSQTYGYALSIYNTQNASKGLYLNPIRTIESGFNTLFISLICYGVGFGITHLIYGKKEKK